MADFKNDFVPAFPYPIKWSTGDNTFDDAEKNPKTIGKNLAGPTSDWTKVSSNLLVVLFEIISNFLITNLLINPLKIKKSKKIPMPISIWKISTPRIPLFQTDKNISEKLLINFIFKFYITKTPLLQD